MAERCVAQTKSGNRCAALAVDGQHCPWHSTAPEWVAKRQGWAAEGGRKRSNAERARKVMPDAMTPSELQGIVSQALRDVINGDLEPGRANAAAALARSLVAIKEAVDVEERLSRLEEAAALTDRRRA